MPIKRMGNKKTVVKDTRMPNPDSKVLKDLRRMVRRENKKG